MPNLETYVELTDEGEKLLWGLMDAYAKEDVEVEGLEAQVLDQLAEEEWSSFGTKVVEVEDVYGDVHEVELEPWHWRTITY